MFTLHVHYLYLYFGFNVSKWGWLKKCLLHKETCHSLILLVEDKQALPEALDYDKQIDSFVGEKKHVTNSWN